MQSTIRDYLSTVEHSIWRQRLEMRVIIHNLKAKGCIYYPFTTCI